MHILVMHIWTGDVFVLDTDSIQLAFNVQSGRTGLPIAFFCKALAILAPSLISICLWSLIRVIAGEPQWRTAFDSP